MPEVEVEVEVGESKDMGKGREVMGEREVVAVVEGMAEEEA